MEVRRGNSKDRKDRGGQNQQASGRRKKWEGGRKEERFDPGQDKPGVRAPGREAGAQCPLLHLSVHRSSSTAFHSIRLAGLPRASCPLGSLSMSGGGRQWRKQLQE